MYGVSVSARILSFPNMCCCCARPGPNSVFTATATRVTGKRVVRTQERSWDFPICAECIEWRDTVLKSRTSYVLMFISLAVTFYMGMDDMTVFALCAGITFVLGLFGFKLSQIANQIKVPSASSVTPAIYHQWNGSVHTFSLANRDYYERFCSSNHAKLLG